MYSTSYGCHHPGYTALPLACGFSMCCLLVQLQGEVPLNLEFLRADWPEHTQQTLLQ